MLQLVANKLSIAQWAQTLSQVRRNLYAVLLCFQGSGSCGSLTGPSVSTHAFLWLQTNRGLHTILPETFVLSIHSEDGKVRSCV